MVRKERTPLLTSAILAAARQIAAAPPRWIEVRAGRGAVPNECFQNVLRRIDRDGGEMALGWRLLEWPGVMLEGEFHALWRTDSGELRDITPNPLGNQSLFIPDPSVPYLGKRVDNRRIALTDDPLVLEFIAVVARLETLTGDNPGANYVAVTPELELVSQRFRQLHDYVCAAY